MKKIISLLTASTMLLTLVACGDSSSNATYEDGTFNGVGEGYIDLVEVSVTVEDGAITAVNVDSHMETNGIGTLAVDALPAEIVAKNGTNVDTVSGATATSNAIIYAVNNALDEANYPTPVEEEKVVASQVASDLYRGLGLSTKGGGNGYEDEDGVPYSSLNHVFANTLFDADGTILAIQIDQLEVSSPNSKSETAPHFYGWPGQSYNYDSTHDGSIDEVLDITEDIFLEGFSEWITKRERGNTYTMTSGSWASQMDAFQEEFVGLNIDEVVEWYEKYCSDVNGRVLKMTDSSYDEDIEKFDALSEEDQAYLVDFTSSASISLDDHHGNILEAIVDSYEKREAVVDVTEVKSHGFGLSTVGRIGPGVDEEGVAIYSFNEVVVYTLFDAEGKIANVKFDQLEVKTQNYDSEYNRFTGLPGTEYAWDVNANGTEYEVKTATEDTLADEMGSLVTKNELGKSYTMGSGTWEDQMNSFAEVFVGMTVEEVSEWFDKYCSDINGRPLKISDSSNEADVEKFEALSADEQEMLVDVTTSATISLNDDHGNMIQALINSFNNRVEIDLTIG